MKPRSREQIAWCAARDIAPGSYVNLGIGMPTMLAAHFRHEDGIIVQSENGMLGLRALAPGEPRDVDLTNAGKAAVGLIAGGAFFDVNMSFAIMRGGHLDCCVLGAYEVAANGDLANWSLDKPGVAPAVGGAMDLAVGAKRVHVVMEHNRADGAPRLIERCTLPLTGQGVVKRVYTELATLDVGPNGFVVIDIVDGLTPEQLQALTGAPLRFALRAAP